MQVSSPSCVKNCKEYDKLSEKSGETDCSPDKKLGFCLSIEKDKDF